MPLVSVWITAYNHENYITEALEGVLMQQTDFDYEIIIGEDCSTDNTRQIVLSYQEKYPEKVRLFLPEKNLGMIAMFKESYNLCSGRYIAWLDGDDYWTDSYKLQKQVDFMETNPEYAMCFHKVTMMNQIKGASYSSSDPNGIDADETLSVKHFKQGYNPVFAVSVLHRKVTDHLPDLFYALPYPDFAFYFLILQYGKIKYSREIMAVYRIRKEGTWSKHSEYNKLLELMLFYKLLIPNVNRMYKGRICKVIGRYCFELLTMDLEQHNFTSARQHLKNIMANDLLLWWNKRRELPHTIRLLLRSLKTSM